MIDRKVHSGFVRPPAEPNADDIKASVNEFLETNPVTPGASAEEAAQIKLNAENIEKLQTLSEGLDTVVISDSAPNTDNKCLWIQSGQYESFDIPQINDETVSEEDTWSSKKISDELNAQVSQLSEENAELKSDLVNKVNYNSISTREETYEEQAVFSFTDKKIENDGSVSDYTGMSVTDFISLDNVTGIYRTGYVDKFMLWNYAFYDANKNFLSIEKNTTDYEFVDYNGKSVTWLKLNENAKYIRIQYQYQRNLYVYNVVKAIDVVDKYDLPYSTFDGIDYLAKATESLDKSNDAKTRTEAITESVLGNNLLNPNNKAVGYYYDFDNGETKITSANYSVTKDTLDVTSDYMYVIGKNISSRLVLWLYDDSSYIGYRMVEPSQWNNKISKISVTGATKAHIGVNSPNIDFKNVCVSPSDIKEFEEYGFSIFVKGSSVKEYEKHYLRGKTVVNFGDSIFGNKRPPEDVSTEIARLTGATVINGGFGGCFMSKHGMSNYEPFSMFRLADAIATGDWSAQEENASKSGMLYYFPTTVKRLKAVDWSKVDIITIAYGTNDFTNPKAIDSTDNTKDTDTFGGALRYSIEKILGAYPNIQIFICGQTYRFWIDSSLNFVEDSDTKIINGTTLPQFVEKTKEIAKEYHLKFIDNYFDLGINKYNRMKWFPLDDGTHHNVDGGHLIARHIVNEMF